MSIRKWEGIYKLAVGEQIISIFVVVLLGAILLPIAFGLIFDANTTGWDDNTVTVFNLIPIIACVALILILVYAYFTRSG